MGYTRSIVCNEHGLRIENDKDRKDRNRKRWVGCTSFHNPVINVPVCLAFLTTDFMVH